MKPLPETPSLPYPQGNSMDQLAGFDQDLVKALWLALSEIARRANGMLPKDGTEPMTEDLDLGGNDIVNVASINGIAVGGGYLTSAATTFAVLKAHDGYFIRLTGANAAVSLPAPATVRVGYRVNIYPYGNTITITPTSGTINGGSFIPGKGGERIECVSDGTNWWAEVQPARIPDYFTLSSNYTPVFLDYEATFRCTAAITLSPSATSVGSGWKAKIIAYNGTVTIDPSGAQTINGQATLVLLSGQSCELISDGSNFFAIVIPAANSWYDRGQVTKAASTSYVIQDLNGATEIDFTFGFTWPTTTGALLMAGSTDNGVTGVGTTGYGTYIVYNYSGAPTVSSANSFLSATAWDLGFGSTIATTASNSFGVRGRIHIVGLNTASDWVQYTGELSYVNSAGNLFHILAQGYFLASTAWNAIRLTSSQNFSGKIRVRAR